MTGTVVPVNVADPALVKAATSVTFGTNKTSLVPGTYTVPVSLKRQIISKKIQWQQVQ